MNSCPICGGEPCHTLRDCHDLCHQIPGSWSYESCGSCGSLWMNPLPRAEEIPGFYPKEYYTHVSATGDARPDPRGKFGHLRLAAKLATVESRWGYEIPDSWWRRGERKKGRGIASRLPLFFSAGNLVRFLPFRAGGRLLDIGCGNGEFLLRMKALGWQVEGIEPDGQAAAVARQRGLSVFRGGIEEADLPADTYDAITLSHVIEHLLDPRAVLVRCVAALRPGGNLVSLSPNPVGRNARALGKIWRQLDPPRHLTLPSPAGYRALLDGLPIEASVFTSPLHMGFFWLWSRKNAGIHRFAFLERLRAHTWDWILGPLLVQREPEAGEEIVCLARKVEAEGRSRFRVRS